MLTWDLGIEKNAESALKTKHKGKTVSQRKEQKALLDHLVVNISNYAYNLIDNGSFLFT